MQRQLGVLAVTPLDEAFLGVKTITDPGAVQVVSCDDRDGYGRDSHQLWRRCAVVTSLSINSSMVRCSATAPVAHRPWTSTRATRQSQPARETRVA
jgi:hypothetical protein